MYDRLWYNQDEAEEIQDHDLSHTFWGIILTSWSIEELNDLADYAALTEKSVNW